MNRDKAFESFMGNIRHDARMDAVESKDEHASRLLSEIHEVMDAGIQSREEAVTLLAKLDIVLEGAEDFATKAAAMNYKTDIRNRYPDITD